ncbi:MAG: nitrogen regulation protein NR(I) [Gammaproteobacteria bacterium]|nr:nitrogen regulation protein NR(I) [Gammaproteobacteria bacterium]
MTVWLVDDDPSIRWVLEKALREAGMQATSFENSGGLLAALTDNAPDVVIADIRMPGMDGLDLIGELHKVNAQLPVIIITAHSDLESAVSAYQSGAFEYLPKPFDVDEATRLVRRAASQGVAEQSSREVLEFPGLIGQAPSMQEVFRAIGRLSGSSMSVLVTGESGTGKELIARALHEHSPRSEQPFVALNTSAIPAELLESELFGHERGAFTGADKRRLGRFEQAHKGTLFLDEIGDMPQPLQTRLLRVLAEGEFFRVGGQTSIKVDVRVLAATHQDLEAKVARGEFREDLFHRLNVIRINAPPLRERRPDIATLLEHYLKVAAAEMEIQPKSLSARALGLLTNFRWPGNVRQLVNACRRLTVLAPGREIREQDIPAELGGDFGRSSNDVDWQEALALWAVQQIDAGRLDVLKNALPEFERTLIRAALAHTGGKRQKAAELLGWGRNTLTRKIKELNLG